MVQAMKLGQELLQAIIGLTQEIRGLRADLDGKATGMEDGRTTEMSTD